MDDLVITCDEVIVPYEEERKTISKNFNEKKGTCKTQKLYILLLFLSITIALLVVVSIYCYLIKYRANWNHLLPFRVTNNELKQVLYG